MIPGVRTHAIPCPHQPPTRSDVMVSVAKMVLSPLPPPAAFANRRGTKMNSTKYNKYIMPV